MAKPERVHERIAAVSPERGGTVGVVARDLASQASVCIKADERWGLDESCGNDDIFAIDQALADQGAPIVMVVHCKSLSHSAQERAPQAIAGIAGLYEHLGEPA